MRPYKRKMLIALVTGLGLGAAPLLYAAYALPSEVACLFVKLAAVESLADGTLVAPGSSESDRALFLALQSQARARIADTFGALRSRSVVTFFQDARTFWPLNINLYGSASSIGTTCVLIGPKGQNVDVVAHELMHQELHERVGTWRLFTAVPVWFNEGVAMQVDFRPKYLLPKEAVGTANNTGEVRGLKSVTQFNRGNGEQRAQHYAFAKAEVAHWLANVGRQDLYQRLERIRAGESFDAVVAK
jgi:hypothetical protein